MWRFPVEHNSPSGGFNPQGTAFSLKPDPRERRIAIGLRGSSFGHACGLDADDASLGEIRQDELKATIKQLEKKMLAAAEDLAYEQAAEYRDEIKRLKKISLAIEG